MSSERKPINIDNIIIDVKKIYHTEDINAYSHLLNSPKAETLDEDDFIIPLTPGKIEDLTTDN